ncbi:cobalt-precorrin-6A reductase [Asaia bogorensis]|uniref:cobalt-precorrin-6A reductase n=1 Tax=Asaia bogorensis TaxID=91915 RepID=UPI000EFBF90D|nr:cobalt-precorrin-6A reductase [Asaia bogorensis]
MHILILGGTTEARQLCHALESQGEDDITFSLAGVTASALPVPSRMRMGGFGGIAGLIAWLTRHEADVVIDATHPFAARMSHHAVAATMACSRPLLRLTRPAWQAGPGAIWRHAPCISAVPAMLGTTPRRVFLTTGRKDLDPFRHTPHHYLLRSIYPPGDALPDGATLLLARGPFRLDDELTLFREHRIDCLVTKNAGAAATAPKLEAARQLGVEVIMVDRPPLPPAEEVDTVEAAMTWLERIRLRGS